MEKTHLNFSQFIIYLFMGCSIAVAPNCLVEGGTAFLNNIHIFKGKYNCGRVGMGIKMKSTSMGFFLVRTCRGFQYLKNRSSFHQPLLWSFPGYTQ